MDDVVQLEKVGGMWEECGENAEEAGWSLVVLTVRFTVRIT